VYKQVNDTKCVFIYTLLPFKSVKLKTCWLYIYLTMITVLSLYISMTILKITVLLIIPK